MGLTVAAIFELIIHVNGLSLPILLSYCSMQVEQQTSGMFDQMRGELSHLERELATCRAQKEKDAHEFSILKQELEMNKVSIVNSYNNMLIVLFFIINLIWLMIDTNMYNNVNMVQPSTYNNIHVQ